jgi:ribose 5-phosphate isomerase B
LKIAVVSDEWHNVHSYIKHWLENKGHTLYCFGSFVLKQDEPWVDVIEQAAKAVNQGECEEGIFFCWSGTGASIVANKIPHIRAALCFDEQTAELARIWNHANVLVLPNRILTEELADKILIKWFETYDTTIGEKDILKINKLEK